MQRLSGYVKFAQDYFSGFEGSIASESDKLYFAKTLLVRGLRIGIIGLNSAWTSGTVHLHGTVDDRGQLVVGEKQVKDAVRMLDRTDVKLALMHHPLSYLRDFDSRDVELELKRSSSFLLRGHLHEADVERTTSLRGNLIVIPAGALYQSRDLVNAYNFVLLDFGQAQAQIVLRRYSDVQQAWLKDLDATGRLSTESVQFKLFFGDHYPSDAEVGRSKHVCAR